MDRFEDLRMFITVVEAGSVTGAAQKLQVAPSAVSRRLKELEARLGAQLLQRTTRRMRLTGTGERFLARAQSVLDDLEDAEREAGNLQAALSGPLRVSVPVSFATAHLRPVLTAFAAEHPGVVLDIDMSDRVIDLISEGYDLAVRIGAMRDSSLIARRLAKIRMVIVGAPAFWDQHGRPTRPEDLRALPALCYTGSDRTDLLRYVTDGGAAESLPLTQVMLSNNGGLLRDAAISSLGFCVQPSFIVAGSVESGALEPVLTDLRLPELTLSAVYPGTRHLPAKARAFIDFLRGKIETTPPWEAFLDKPVRSTTDAQA